MRDRTIDVSTRAGTAGIDPRSFRTILGRFATGVVGITALDADAEPVGLAVNSFTSVSLEPPLVAFCIAHTSRSWPRIRQSRRHCLNILGGDQRAVSAQLAGRNPAKFDGVDWTPSPSGMPILEGSLGWLECSVEAEHPAGDHMIVVSRVRHASAGSDCGEPLVFFSSEYGTFGAR